MSLIRTCKNVAAEKLVEPYMTGMEVGWINRFYAMLDNKTYQEIVDYAFETNDRRMQTVIEITGERLRELIRN